jgi:hypothetical protein
MPMHKREQKVEWYRKETAAELTDIVNEYALRKQMK